MYCIFELLFESHHYATFLRCLIIHHQNFRNLFLSSRLPYFLEIFSKGIINDWKPTLLFYFDLIEIEAIQCFQTMWCKIAPFQNKALLLAKFFSISIVFSFFPIYYHFNGRCGWIVNFGWRIQQCLISVNWKLLVGPQRRMNVNTKPVLEFTQSPNLKWSPSRYFLKKLQ